MDSNAKVINPFDIIAKIQNNHLTMEDKVNVLYAKAQLEASVSGMIQDSKTYTSQEAIEESIQYQQLQRLNLLIREVFIS